MRSALTFLAAALVVGGLVRLATDNTRVAVATGDLTVGTTRADVSPAVGDTEENAEKPPKRKDGVNALDAAIVTALLRTRGD